MNVDSIITGVKAENRSMVMFFVISQSATPMATGASEAMNGIRTRCGFPGVV